jgi:uncharacterized delta-60 repeat protein
LPPCGFDPPVPTGPPATLWTRTYGGAAADYAYSIQQTSDGGYILAGSRGPVEANRPDFFLVKTNGQGDTMWTRDCGGSGWDEASSVQQTTDGGYIVAGSTFYITPNDYDLYLVKTNAQGDTLWTRTYGGGGYDFARSVQQTTDGGYIVVGSERFAGFNDDVYLVKTNSQGDTLWTRTYGGSNWDEGYSVQQTADGGYIIAGTTASYGAGSDDFYLVKTDNSGNPVWTRTYGGGSWDEAFSVKQTPDGGYIIAGSTESFGAGREDIYLVKTNAAGDTLWTRTYGGWSYDVARSVQPTIDGGYILGGYTESFGVCWNDFYLVKTNSVGDTLWTRTYGGWNEEYAYSVQQTADGGYVMAGYTTSTWDILVVKTGPDRIASGYLTLNTSGPPSWSYQLHWIRGDVTYLLFTNTFHGTLGSVSGAAASAGWTANNYNDCIVFTTPNPLTSGSIATFTLTSNDYIPGPIYWTIGDSSGLIDGPLAVELISFLASAGDHSVNLNWQTASESNNEHFDILRDGARVARVHSQGNTASGHEYSWNDERCENGTTYNYSLVAVDINGQTQELGVQSVTPRETAASITEYALQQNYPNPFNPSTKIVYDMKEAGYVTVKVYNLLGQVVATLVNTNVNQGRHSMNFDAAGLPSGVYVCRMETAGFEAQNKMLLMK